MNLKENQNVPMCDPSATPPMTLEQVCNKHRASLKEIEDCARAIAVSSECQPGEAKEQAMLAVRHLEDARMRLGKVIQHTVGGGVSCFDSGRPTADDGR